MKKTYAKNKDSNNEKFIHFFIAEVFYFMSAVLVLGLIVELVWPGLFQLYFNSSFLVFLWLINAFLLILYD